jgi:hypothetical protein
VAPNQIEQEAANGNAAKAIAPRNLLGFHCLAVNSTLILLAP